MSLTVTEEPILSFDLIVVFAFLVVSGAALLVFLLLGRFLRMKVPGAEKASTYECGERPVGSAWFNFNSRFYIIALIFVAFDVMVVLTVPVVVVFRKMVMAEQGYVAFLVLFIFLTMMIIALAYLWRSGDLSWVKELRSQVCTTVELGKKEDN